MNLQAHMQLNILIAACEWSQLAMFRSSLQHTPSVEWQVHSVHAKLPQLHIGRGPFGIGAWVIPDEVSGNERARGDMHKHDL